jgi:GT2 family glycosyltransferase
MSAIKRGTSVRSHSGGGAMRSRLIEVYSREGSAEAECSVIVPVYNGARFLADSIAAVFAQTDIICDILMSDDCSEDGSLDAILGLAKSYSGTHSIRVYRTSEPAVCEHMPLLVAASRSDRIIQAHQDDVSDPGRARALAAALTGDVKLVTSIARTRTGKRVTEPAAKDLEILRNNANLAALLGHGRGVISGACYGMHRDIFRCFPALSRDYLSHGHDVLLHIRARMIGDCRIVYSPLLTIGDHPDRGYYQLVDRQSPATTAFDYSLRRLAILRTARSELDIAHTSGLVDDERKQSIGKVLDDAREHFLDTLITSREVAIRRGFRLSWIKRAGRLG